MEKLLFWQALRFSFRKKTNTKTNTKTAVVKFLSCTPCGVTAQITVSFGASSVSFAQNEGSIIGEPF